MGSTTLPGRIQDSLYWVALSESVVSERDSGVGVAGVSSLGTIRDFQETAYRVEIKCCEWSGPSSREELKEYDDSHTSSR